MRMRLDHGKAFTLPDGFDVKPAPWLVAAALVASVGFASLWLALAVSAIRWLWTH